MTREKMLKVLSTEYVGDSDTIIEAKKMAIKIIQQEPCEDYISRQAVLNILFYKSDGNGEVRLSKELRDRIKSLSPVTPKPKTDTLDKIIAEIEQTADEEQKHDEKWAIGLRYAVKIINKYKVESEDE